VINKYNKWYCSIVEQAKNRIKRDGVLYEKHHIIPKHIGGTDDPSNPIHRDKVAQSKIGRKRFYMPDGSFKYIRPESA
jgi:hypothetical protein